MIPQERPEAVPDAAQACLEGYLGLGEQEDGSGALRRLLLEFAEPLVQRVVKRKLYEARGVNAADAEDVCANALAAIIERLRRLRAGDAEPIEHFASFAAGVAGTAADRFFGQRAPQRSRLRARIRYVLTTDSRFALRGEGAEPVWAALAGKAAGAPRKTSPLAELVHRVLEEAAGEIPLGDLTSRCAHLLGVSDQTEPVEEVGYRLADSRERTAERLELRDWLRMIWEEVTLLPLAQRLALLLHLGAAQGAALRLVPDLGIASFRQVAQVMGMSAEELAEIWNRLPMADKEIAERLDLARQQVVNLRSAARQRLNRRLDANTVRDSRTED